MHLAPIQTDTAQPQIAHLMRDQQYLGKHLFDLCQKLLPEPRDGRMVRMQPPSYESKWNHLVGRLLNLARTEYPGRVPIQQQPQQHLRINRLTTHRRIVSIEHAQVQYLNNTDHEASQMVSR